MNRPDRIALVASAFAAALFAAVGCEEKQPAAPSAPAQSQPAKPADDHAHEQNSDAGHAHDDHAHSGPVIDLGSVTAGPFAVKATRDAGEIVAGKDAAFDLTVNSADTAGPKVVAVRIWIGKQDAKGSVKARAEIENPQEPSRWHTHAEVPSPMPEGSKLWFEIEDDKGGRHVSSVELKH